MASSEIDWAKPVEFENGASARLLATLSQTGKCAFTTGQPSQHADMFATMYESGVRFLVRGEDDDIVYTYGALGRPARSWESAFTCPAMAIQNADTSFDMGSMDQLAEWGIF